MRDNANTNNVSSVGVLVQPGRSKRLLLLFALIILFIIVAGVLTYLLQESQRERQVKQNVLNKNPEITRVYSIETLGGWGEGKEFSLVVESEGKIYRVWTAGDGNLSDKVLLPD